MSRRAVIQKLESLKRAGVTHLPKGTPRPVTSSAEVTSAEMVAGSETVTSTEPASIAQPVEASVPGQASSEHVQGNVVTEEGTMAAKSRSKKAVTAELEVIQKEVAACTLCSELASTRTQTVFGVGNPKAKLVFLGEAPGADEDRQGEPFVGRAGKLLTDIVQNGMGLTRDDIYILNILKCRPPGNRNPAPEEAANCRGFLDRQLATIKPKFLCCLGAVAAHNLFETTTPIGQMRGKWYDYQGIRVMCSYHPAYLLRNPPAKKDTWQDIQMLMAEMGLQPPPRS